MSTLLNPPHSPTSCQTPLSLSDEIPVTRIFQINSSTLDSHQLVYSTYSLLVSILNEALRDRVHFQLPSQILKELCSVTENALGLDSKQRMSEYARDAAYFQDLYFDTSDGAFRADQHCANVPVYWLRKRILASDSSSHWTLKLVSKGAKPWLTTDLELNDDVAIRNELNSWLRRNGLQVPPNSEEQSLDDFITRIGLVQIASMSVTRYIFPERDSRPEIQVDIAQLGSEKYFACASIDFLNGEFERSGKEILSALGAIYPVRSKIAQLLSDRGDDFHDTVYKEPLIYDEDPLAQNYIQPQQCYTSSEARQISIQMMEEQNHSFYEDCLTQEQHYTRKNE